MKRIILHWTAGADGVNATERDHYHVLIARDGSVTRGDFPISANIPPLVEGRYAAHTRGANSHAIGVALDAMAGAVDRPFNAGRYPITATQLSSMARAVADLCEEYGIAVTRQTVLTHAEVQPTLGIKQNAKWDIAWIPGMDRPGDPVAVGDKLRAMIVDAGRWMPAPFADSRKPDPVVKPALWQLPYGNPLADFIAGVIAAIASLFRK